MTLVSTVGAGPVKILPPYSWGSHCSRLVKLLDEGHYDVKLDAESIDLAVSALVYHYLNDRPGFLEHLQRGFQERTAQPAFVAV